MASSETLPFPPGYECPGCPEVCQNGTLRVTGRVWWVYGGGTEGERWGKGGGKVGGRWGEGGVVWVGGEGGGGGGGEEGGGRRGGEGGGGGGGRGGGRGGAQRLRAVP